MPSPERPQKISHNIDSPFYYEYNARRVLARLEAGTNPLAALIAEARDKGKLFVGKEKEFEALLTDLANAKYINTENLVKIFGEKMSRFAQSNFSLSELEMRARDPKMDSENRVHLSGILNCNFRTNHQNEISIHIKPSSTLPPEERSKGIRDGFAKLAELIENDPKFKKATSIFARSWIVKDLPEYFVKLGFTILEENERDRSLGTRSARISRENFVARYKSKA